MKATLTRAAFFFVVYDGMGVDFGQIGRQTPRHRLNFAPNFSFLGNKL